MEKRKVRFTISVTREREIDLADYQNMGDMEPCKTIEEAVKFDAESIEQDPFMFMDDEDAKLEVKYEILPD